MGHHPPIQEAGTAAVNASVINWILIIIGIGLVLLAIWYFLWIKKQEKS